MELLELYKNLAEERKKVLDHTEKLLIEKEKEIERLRNTINEKCYNNIKNITNTNKKYILIFKIAEESFKFINKTISIRYINTTCDNLQILNELNNESSDNQTIFIALSKEKIDVVDIIKDMLDIKNIDIKLMNSTIVFNRKYLSEIIQYFVICLRIEECTLFKNDKLFRINIDQVYIKKELERYLVYKDKAYRSLMFLQQSLCYDFKKTIKHISNEDLIGCKIFDLDKNYLGMIYDIIIDETNCLILYND